MYIVHSIDYNLFFFNNNYPLNTSHKIIENGVGFFFFSPLVSTEKEKKVQRVGPDVGKVIAKLTLDSTTGGIIWVANMNP